MDYLYLLLGIVLLLLGGDLLVRASVELALRIKISVLVVGMTVVSFATSAPELLVSLEAALNGYTDISFGNVVGSNMANISLILGATALVFPIAVNPTSYKIDWWVMMGVTILLFLFLFNDSTLLRYEAAIFVVLLILYNYIQIRNSRRKTKAQQSGALEEVQRKRLHLGLAILFLILGVAALKFGSDFLVKGAVSIAQAWNVSERVIGLTIVSIGTSLPELAASMVASFKGEQELSLGNLIGSNIFNILAVLGFTGLVIDIPMQSEALLTFDLPVLFGLMLLLYPLMRFSSKGKIERWEGGLMFLAYIAYTIYLFL